MKKQALTLALLGLVIAAVWLLFNRTRPEQRRALFQREAAAFILGQYLANKFPHQPVLIASNPFTKLSGRPRDIYQFEAAGIDGLSKAFRDRINHKIVFPKLRPGAAEHPESLYVDPQSKTPLSFLVTDESFDKLFAENPEFKICASLIGLPSNLTQSQSWRKPDLKFALLLPDWRLIGSPESIRIAFKSEKIVAAIVNRPDLSNDVKSNDRNHQKVFDQHFLLITPANCDELMNRYRRLF